MLVTRPASKLVSNETVTSSSSGGNKNVDNTTTSGEAEDEDNDPLPAKGSAGEFRGQRGAFQLSDRRKQVGFQQTHDQGMRGLFLKCAPSVAHLTPSLILST